MESRIEFSGARLNKASRGQRTSLVTLKIVSDFAINISVLPEILQMGQWTWVRAYRSTDGKLPNKASKSRTVMPTSSPWAHLKAQLVSILLASSIFLSQEPPRVVIVKRVWRRDERGEPEVPHQEKNFALHGRWLGWVPYRRSLTGAQLTFQIQYHPLSKRTEESEST